VTASREYIGRVCPNLGEAFRECIFFSSCEFHYQASTLRDMFHQEKLSFPKRNTTILASGLILVNMLVDCLFALFPDLSWCVFSPLPTPKKILLG
jgi:hypothetical protein